MFDTLKFARNLRDRGHFSPEQAEGLADAVAEAMETEVAGRADLKATETALRGEIAGLRTELKAEIADLRTELKAEIADLRTEIGVGLRSLEAKIEATQTNTIKWVVGIVGFQGIALIGAALVLARALVH